MVNFLNGMVRFLNGTVHTSCIVMFVLNTTVARYGSERFTLFGSVTFLSLHATVFLVRHGTCICKFRRRSLSVFVLW